MASHRLTDAEIRHAIKPKVSLEDIRAALDHPLRDGTDAKVKELLAMGESKGFHHVAAILRSPHIRVSDEIRSAALNDDAAKIEELLLAEDLRRDLRFTDSNGLRMDKKGESIEESERLLGSINSLISNIRGTYTDHNVQATLNEADAALADMLAGRTLSPEEREIFIVSRIILLIDHAKNNPRSKNVYLKKAAQIAKANRIDPHSFSSFVKPHKLERHMHD